MFYVFMFFLSFFLSFFPSLILKNKINLPSPSSMLSVYQMDLLAFDFSRTSNILNDRR